MKQYLVVHQVRDGKVHYETFWATDLEGALEAFRKKDPDSPINSITLINDFLS